tara:strand:+ start:33 stop:653 length:621 start_codon:yes stop_codon:yes gene_type:complete
MNKIPQKYFQGLSAKNKKLYKKEIIKSKVGYKKGNYYTRKPMKSFKSKKSGHIVKFEKLYCGTKISDHKNVAKMTGVPKSAQDKIIKKGQAAYYSSGSRPSQTPHSWAYARLASALTYGNAYKVDKHVLDEAGVKIKKPPKVCKNKGKNKSKIKSCKSKNLNEKKDKKCRRESDNKIFTLPRKFSRKKCKNAKGFTMKSSCAPFKN